MADKKKATFIVSSTYAIIGNSGSPSDLVGPNERVQFNEDSDSHKYLRSQIEAGDPAYEHLSIEEVDLGDEAKHEEERKEQLAKAEKIAAKVREDEAKEALEAQENQDEQQAQAREEGQAGATEGTNFPPQDLEAVAIAEQQAEAQESSSGSRRRSTRK
jgi:hypothetical protein